MESELIFTKGCNEIEQIFPLWCPPSSIMLRILGEIFLINLNKTLYKGQSSDTVQVTLSTVMISDE